MFDWGLKCGIEKGQEKIRAFHCLIEENKNREKGKMGV